MDLEQTVRNVLDSLPVIFTASDVVERTGLPPSTTFKVNAVLKRLAEQGVVTRSVVLGRKGSGRPPFGWSAKVLLSPQGVVDFAVEHVLPSMPRLFSLRDLMDRLQVGSGLRGLLNTTLNRLAAEGKIVRCTERQPGTRGRPAPRWSADPKTVADEIRIRELLAKGAVDLSSRLDRLTKPWDPKV